MKVLLLGDSHINQFRGRGTYFNLGGEVLTGQRLVEGYQPIETRLQEWLLSQGGSGSGLVVSLNEVDIRGHYWRHIPRSGDVQQYVRDRVHAFHNRLSNMLVEAKLSRIVLWGAPPAGLNITNNPHWPFVGSTATRNRIIDLFNREFAKLVKPGGPIVFCTGFYQYMNMDTHEPVGHIPSDGVHWADSLAEQFWTDLVNPALLTGEQPPIPPGPEYVIGQAEVSNLDQYDSWIRVESGQGYEGHTVEYFGQTWELVTQDRVPENRSELVLVNR